MEPATLTLSFAHAVRLVGAEARRRGLAVPGFRSPPGVAGADRTVRRLRDGGAIVAVRLRGRSLPDIVADLVDGVLAANGLARDGEAGAAHRSALLAAAGGLVEAAAA